MDYRTSLAFLFVVLLAGDRPVLMQQFFVGHCSY